MASEKLIYASAVRREILKADPKLAYIIDNIPTVDAVEVVHGRWVEHMPNVYECTACHTWYGNYGGCDEWGYCPNCGAKMDGGNEDD